MKENVDEAQQKERIEVFRLNSVDGSRRSLGFLKEFAFYGLYKNAIFLYNIIESFLSWKKL